MRLLSQIFEEHGLEITPYSTAFRATGHTSVSFKYTLYSINIYYLLDTGVLTPLAYRTHMCFLYVNNDYHNIVQLWFHENEMANSYIETFVYLA